MADSIPDREVPYVTSVVVTYADGSTYTLTGPYMRVAPGPLERPEPDPNPARQWVLPQGPLTQTLTVIDIEDAALDLPRLTEETP